MFLVYCMLMFMLAGSVGMIVHCLVSVSREPSFPKLSAITAAILLCILLMLIAKQSGNTNSFLQPIFQR